MTAVMAMVLAFGATACGGKYTGPTIDPNKTQIYVYTVENGIGHQWMKDLAAKWNETQEEYEVIPRSGGDDLLVTFDGWVTNKATDVNIYFGCQSAIFNMIQNGNVLDLSPVYNMVVDEDGDTIAQKTFNYDAVISKAFTDENGNGIYAIPYATGMSGLVFDYDMFVENGYMKYASVSDKATAEAQGAQVTTDSLYGLQVLKLSADFKNYSAGDVLLSAGKDGKFGTYDDGQAETWEEFYEMLSIILEDMYGYVYTTKSYNAYVPTVYNAMLAQFMGYENYTTMMTLDGTITEASGATTPIKPSTGVNVWQSKVVQDAYAHSMQFFYDNIIGKVGSINGTNYNNLLHPASTESGLTHKSAQTKFVQGFMPNSTGEAAFLVEGVWWEGTEAKGVINQAARESGDPTRAYGVREYRYYLYPDMEGQVGEKSVVACQDDGCGVRLNVYPEKCKTTEEKRAFDQKCYEFLAFTLSDESLQHYTKTHGIGRPFDYTMSEEDLAMLTPFQRAAWEISHDTENIDVVCPQYMKNLSLVRSKGGFNDYYAAVGADTFTTPQDAFALTNPTTYLTNLFKDVAANYTSAYDKVKEYINE